MNGPLPILILNHGSCEPLKAVVHGLSLGLAAVMGAYNIAAWLQRRERHLAINAALYTLAILWEQRLVTHHLDACRRQRTCDDDIVPVAETRIAGRAVA